MYGYAIYGLGIYGETELLMPEFGIARMSARQINTAGISVHQINMAKLTISRI
jgi:hypothetical protein